MAAAARGNLFGPTSVRLTMDEDARVSIETEMTDIGTGTYTILAQIAADLLGVPIKKVDVRRRAGHKEKNAGLCLGSKVRGLGAQWIKSRSLQRLTGGGGANDAVLG